MSSGTARRGSFSARPRSDIPTAIGGTGAETSTAKDGFPCPRQVKPLLHFYKYLQPLPDGRKLQLHVPATVVCDKIRGHEELLTLRTDASGFVVKDDADPAWRKRLLAGFLGEDPQSAASLLSVALDDVVAVRNVAHWKSAGSSDSNSKSLVLTRRAFDHVISAPCELAFSVQQFVRCRGSHASIFRVTWGERENRRFAINIFNENKMSDASSSPKPTLSEEDRPQGTSLDTALCQMEALSPFYLVTATSGWDSKRQQQQSKLPRIRGNPVADAVGAVKRIADHFTAQLPGIRVRELTADFIKDIHGVWWFIRAVRFDACYRVEVPQSVQNHADIDSAASIHDLLRSNYFRQALRTIASTTPANYMVPQCSLCGCSCVLPKLLRDELHQLNDALLSESKPRDVFRVLTEYRMTLKMVISTLFQVRQRGASLPIWEHAALLLTKTPAGRASEFTVCYLCYQIYKSHLVLARTAHDLNEAYGIPQPSHGQPEWISTATEQEKSHTSDVDDPGDRAATSKSLHHRITRFYRETCVSLMHDEGSPTRPNAALPDYTAITGADIDPTCMQLRFVFFFHELQDGGPNISASDFYLEYHLGQHFTRLDFDGSKRHTLNRWQLCEARVHYLLATKGAFGDYCNDKRLQIKMKTVGSSEYHGHTSLSLRPLLSAAKWLGNTLQQESRVDYLLELRTDAFGLLTLKVTLGLVVDSVPLNQVRELVKQDEFLREGPLDVFWPPPSFQSCSLPVPVDWIGALMPSEYVSILPRRTRHAPRLGGVRGAGDSSFRKLLQDSKSPSQRFSTSTLTEESTQARPQDPTEESSGTIGVFQPSQRVLSLVCMIAKRLIYRVAGTVTSFPTVVLGHILRHARHLAPGRSRGGVASWSEPADFQLTQTYTVDTLLHDIDVASSAALCVVGEILLILTQCQLLEGQLYVAHLERIVAPFWLVEASRGANEDELSFEPMSCRVSSVPAQQRMVWNRAVRRCRVAHFCAEFRVYNRATVKPAEQDQDPTVAVSNYKEMQMLCRQMSFRTKHQAHAFCEIFELMETSDLGYIDIAEVRSFHKCLGKERCTAELPEQPRFSGRDPLELHDLDTLSAILAVNHANAQSSLIQNLMSSQSMAEVLSQFDQFGAGTMNFDEFWELAESVLSDHAATVVSHNEEPTDTVFCLRHGSVEAFQVDRCCVRCSFQYQDQKFLHRKIGFYQAARSVSSKDDSGSDSESEEHLEDEEKTATKPETLSSVTMRNLGSSIEQLQPIEAGGDLLFNESSLENTLQQLKAAEWYVRHRQDSLDRAALGTLFSARHSSAALSARRTSTVSSLSEKLAQSPLSMSFSVTEFVTEAEERKQLAFAPSVVSKITPTPKKAMKQKKKRSAKSSALNSTRLEASHSLSTLLRAELTDASVAGDHSRSTRLADKVYRGETKRNKLDKLVLAELDDVKQRLARLLASS